MDTLTVIDDSALSVKLTPLEREVCELKADLLPHKQIAERVGLRVTDIKRILAKEDCRKFTEALIVARNKASFAAKALRVKLISEIIEDKLAKMEEEGVRLADATKKDVIELVNILDDILKEQEKQELGTAGDVYVNIMQAVMDK